ncbi:MAG: cyaA 1 [Betaproteobacteria bacterium]|nr:cyaA 1 [Betaproteobacteria bacterium]
MKPGENVEATFCFVDIAGYTALTDQHGELAAANLVDDFNHFVSIAVSPFGKVHELIGDCAFLVFANPLSAHRALAALYASIADRRDFPVVRAGLHHGPALLRSDRYFGSAVNTAARIAAQASGGEILCSREVAELLTETPTAGIEVTHKQAMRLKNLPQPIDIYEVVLPGLQRECAIDPVCKMQVDAAHAAGHLHLNDQTYWFCSLDCVAQFSGNPDAYI